MMSYSTPYTCGSKNNGTLKAICLSLSLPKVPGPDPNAEVGPHVVNDRWIGVVGAGPLSSLEDEFFSLDYLFSSPFTGISPTGSGLCIKYGPRDILLILSPQIRDPAISSRLRETWKPLRTKNGAGGKQGLLSFKDKLFNHSIVLFPHRAPPQPTWFDSQASRLMFSHHSSRKSLQRHRAFTQTTRQASQARLPDCESIRHESTRGCQQRQTIRARGATHTRPGRSSVSLIATICMSESWACEATRCRRGRPLR